MDKESTEVHVSGVEAEATVSPAEAIADKAFEAWVEAMELEITEDWFLSEKSYEEYFSEEAS